MSDFYFQPEWFLTQILNWKRDHMQFIEGYIDPLLKECTKDDEFSLKVCILSLVRLQQHFLYNHFIYY